MKTYRLAVLGHPLNHTLSPLMHQIWFEMCGLAGTYQAIETDGTEQGFKDTVYRIQDKGFQGVNVTLPHKKHAYLLSDKVSDQARLTQAVNTLLFHSSGIIEGHNTDIEGFIRNIASHKLFSDSLCSGCAMVLGAGGATRSVLLAILQQGYQHIMIANRTQSRAQEIVDFFQPNFSHATFQVINWLNWPKIIAKLPKNALVVNTTSLGMQGNAALNLIEQWPENLLVTDIVYNPLMTPLLLQAEKAGMSVQDGFDMLLYQGAASFSLWTGHQVVVEKSIREKLLK